MSQRRYQKENLKVGLGKWKWKCNIPKLMGHSKKIVLKSKFIVINSSIKKKVDLTKHHLFPPKLLKCKKNYNLNDQLGHKNQKRSKISQII